MGSIDQAMRSAIATAALLRERWQSGVAYNPLSARMAQDPYPVYATLRARDPVHRSRLLNAWLFTRHADVDAILRNYRHFGNDPRSGTLTARQRGRSTPISARSSRRGGPRRATIFSAPWCRRKTKANGFPHAKP